MTIDGPHDQVNTNPTVRTLQLIAKALEVTLDDLVEE